MDRFQQGDIIYIDFNPTKGHEQAGRRPALVVSQNDYQRLMGLHLVCPITNNTKEFPTHVLLDGRTNTTGAILCEHIRSIDASARNATKKEECPNDILDEVLDTIHLFF